MAPVPLLDFRRRSEGRAVPAVPLTSWNPADKHADLTLSNGELTVTNVSVPTAFKSLRAIASSSTAKTYFECTLDVSGGPGGDVVGIGNASASLAGFTGGNVNSCGLAGSNSVYLNNSPIAIVGSYLQGDTISIAVDLTAKLIWFRVNAGNWNNSGAADPATGVNGIDIAAIAAGPYFPMSTAYTSADAWTANFGGTAYAQSVPAGFVNW